MCSDALPDTAVSRRPLEPGQYLSIVYTERLAAEGGVTSVGSKGDSFDNALAESVIGLYKSELIYNRGPWRTVDDVELATLGWVHWWNTTRLHSAIGDVPPAEFEAAHTLTNTWPLRLGSTKSSLYRTRGGSDCHQTPARRHPADAGNGRNSAACPDEFAWMAVRHEG
jgi:putative transposase